MWFPGKVIGCIPQGGPLGQKSSKPDVGPAAAAGRAIYQVRPGDNLGSIWRTKARPLGVTYADFQRLNLHLLDEKHRYGQLIRPGEWVRLRACDNPSPQGARVANVGAPRGGAHPLELRQPGRPWVPSEKPVQPIPNATRLPGKPQDYLLPVGSGAAVAPSRAGEAQGAEGAGRAAPVGRMEKASAPRLGPGSKVLVLGDSYSVGQYGKRLGQRLRSTGASVEAYGATGVTAAAYLNGTSVTNGFLHQTPTGQAVSVSPGKRAQVPRLDELLRKQKPDLVIVSLGPNYLPAARGGKHAAGNLAAADLRRVADQVKASGAKLVWVGTPDTSRFSEAAEVDVNRGLRLAARQTDSLFVDPKPLQAYRGGDGLHPATHAASSLADKVFDRIQAVLAGE